MPKNLTLASFKFPWTAAWFCTPVKWGWATICHLFLKSYGTRCGERGLELKNLCGFASVFSRSVQRELPWLCQSPALQQPSAEGWEILQEKLEIWMFLMWIGTAGQVLSLTFRIDFPANAGWLGYSWLKSRLLLHPQGTVQAVGTDVAGTLKVNMCWHILCWATNIDVPLGVWGQVCMYT